MAIIPKTGFGATILEISFVAIVPIHGLTLMIALEIFDPKLFLDS